MRRGGGGEGRKEQGILADWSFLTFKGGSGRRKDGSATVCGFGEMERGGGRSRLTVQ